MDRVKITSAALFVAFVLTAVWLALVIAAPFMVPSGTLLDLSGTVGRHENDAQFRTLSPLPKAIYWIGDGECHQMATRSYFLNGNQMPFCARDLGLFAGLAIGFGLVTFMELVLNPLYLLLGLVPMGVDGGLQLLTRYESTNPLRLATGIIAGFALAVLIGQYVFALGKGREPRKPPEGYEQA